MKHLDQFPFLQLGIISFFILLNSCINSIGTEPEESEENIPVALTSRIQQDNTANNLTNFEENAEIGVYIISVNSNLSEQRHIDNMKFSYSDSKGFEPDKAIFFPEDNTKCDIFAYYPFREQAIEDNKSSMEISVFADQTEWTAFTQSDFLTAVSNNITPADDPVNLTFRHKLNCINIQMKADGGYTAEQLLAANPEITIRDVFIKAVYDFNQDSFSQHNTPGSLQPYGDWEITDGILTGKSLMIIPQEIGAQHSLIEIRTDIGDYQYSTTETYKFDPGNSENLIITLSPNSESLKCTIDTNIEGWGVPKEKKITVSKINSFIKLEDININSSYYVYEVSNRGNKVAEICLEYLSGANIAAQSIVVYPMKDGKTDLQNGFVAKIIGETANIHGGTVSWNTTNNSLIYTEGTSPEINYIYVSSDGRIVSSRPENALQIQLTPEVHNDNRGNETNIYQIVKIGTQYWMRNNLRATKYLDNSEIYQSENFNDSPAKFFANGSYFFYNSAAIKTGLLIPDGWRISSSADWEQLSIYINGDTSVLKRGTTWGENLSYPATNISGFNAVATGYYDDVYTNYKKYGFYWSTHSNKPTEVEKIIVIGSESNALAEEEASDLLGLSIRCLRN